MSRGINVDGWFAHSKNTPAHWERHITSVDIAKIRDLGFTSVRLPVDPEPFQSNSHINHETIRFLDRGLDLLREHDLVAVVDLHTTAEYMERALGDSSGLATFEQFLENFARHLSSRDPSWVVLEPLNEPRHHDRRDAEWDWNAVLRRLWQAARRGAPDHTLILSGDGSSSIEALLRVRPVPDTNVIYTFHFYSPFVFTHQGAWWGLERWRHIKQLPYPSDSPSVEAVLPEILAGVENPKTRGDLADFLRRYGADRWDRSVLDRSIRRAAEWAKSHGVRLWVGEFGVRWHEAPPENRYAWLRDARELFEEYGVGWAMYEYHRGFALVQARRQPNMAIVQSLGLTAREP